MARSHVWDFPAALNSAGGPAGMFLINSYSGTAASNPLSVGPFFVTGQSLTDIKINGGYVVVNYMSRGSVGIAHLLNDALWMYNESALNFSGFNAFESHFCQRQEYLRMLRGSFTSPDGTPPVICYVAESSINQAIDSTHVMPSFDSSVTVGFAITDPGAKIFVMTTPDETTPVAVGMNVVVMCHGKSGSGALGYFAQENFTCTIATLVKRASSPGNPAIWDGTYNNALASGFPGLTFEPVTYNNYFYPARLSATTYQSYADCVAMYQVLEQVLRGDATAAGMDSVMLMNNGTQTSYDVQAVVDTNTSALFAAYAGNDAVTVVDMNYAMFPLTAINNFGMGTVGSPNSLNSAAYAAINGGLDTTGVHPNGWQWAWIYDQVLAAIESQTGNKRALVSVSSVAAVESWDRGVGSGGTDGANFVF